MSANRSSQRSFPILSSDGRIPRIIKSNAHLDVPIEMAGRWVSIKYAWTNLKRRTHHNGCIRLHTTDLYHPISPYLSFTATQTDPKRQFTHIAVDRPLPIQPHTSPTLLQISAMEPVPWQVVNKKLSGVKWFSKRLAKLWSHDAWYFASLGFTFYILLTFMLSRIEMHWLISHHIRFS